MKDFIKKRKIVHVIGALAAGGAEKFVVDLLCELKKRKLNVSLLSLSNKKDALGIKFNKILKNNNISCSSGPTERVKLKSLLWYIMKIYAIKPDILHLHTSNTVLAQFFANCFFIKPKIIIRTLHSTNLSKDKLKSISQKLIDVKINIACSSSVEKKYRNFLKNETKCIQNGIQFFWPIRNTFLSNKYKEKLGLENKGRHYICVGSLRGKDVFSAQKAHNTLIAAWKKSSVGELGGYLHILGEGELRDDLMKIAKNDSSIIFHGIKDNISEWLIASDCFVMPSRWEGLPIAAIEAIGTGLKCIFSNITPLYELNPPLVSWVNVDDVDELSDRIYETYLDERFINIKDIIDFRNMYNISNTAKKYNKLYLKVLNNYKPKRSFLIIK